MKKGLLEVGYSVPRTDAWTKVTGEEKYAADYCPENLLWAGAKRAGTPHGRILEIDGNRGEGCRAMKNVFLPRSLAALWGHWENEPGAAPPGGRDFLNCTHRVLPALYAALASATGNLLIVGHAGVNRILLSLAQGRSLADLFAIPQEYGCLNLMTYREFEFAVESLNGTI